MAGLSGAVPLGSLLGPWDPSSLLQVWELAAAGGQGATLSSTQPPEKRSPVSLMAAATFQEGKSQSSSARGSACITLLLSPWLKQVTQPSPELLWASPIQGHGFQEAWFVGAMMSLSICHRNGPGFPTAFPALVSGILSFLGHLTREGSAQRRMGAGDVKKTREPAQRGSWGSIL